MLYYPTFEHGEPWYSSQMWLLLVLKAARDPSNYDVDKTREGARALLRTAVASSHAPLRTETLTSVYADLKGGAGQEGGCRVRDRKGPNTPNTTKSFFFLRRFLFFGKPRREASKARAFSFYFNGWWCQSLTNVARLKKVAGKKSGVTEFWMRHFFWENVRKGPFGLQGHIWTFQDILGRYDLTF